MASSGPDASSRLIQRIPPNGTQWHEAAWRTPIGLDEDQALVYAQASATAFGVAEDREVEFDTALAIADTKEKT